jgi:hypothetical protein
MLTSTLRDAQSSGSAPTPDPRAIEPVVSPATPSLAAGLAQALRTLGVRTAFGILGGGIAPIAEALQTEGIAVYHFRHEAGAAFAAVEASLAADRPTVVFVTLGPGLTNAITGIVAARSEGARVVVLSGLSPPATRGRFALQETAPQTLPSDLFTAGALFDAAEVIENPCQLSVSLSRLAHGLARPAGFVAHLAIAAATALAPIGSAQRALAPRASFPRTIPPTLARAGWVATSASVGSCVTCAPHTRSCSGRASESSPRSGATSSYRPRSSSTSMWTRPCSDVHTRMLARSACTPRSTTSCVASLRA